MKAVELSALRQMRLVERPMPRIVNPGDVLLKIKVIGVCGSDVHYYTTGRIGSQVVQYPFMVGHEFSAVVEQVGSAVKNLKPGKRVAVDPAMPCHTCDQCKVERENTCRKLNFLGCPGQVEGCLCEYIVMPAHCCFPVADDITLEQAMLAEPLSIGTYAVKQSHLQPGMTVAVLGCGPIGLSCMAAAKYYKAGDIFVTEKIQSRMKAALDFGAKWAGNPENENIVSKINSLAPAGMDIVYECAGQQETLDQALEILKPGGKLMLIGIPEFDRVSFSIDRLRRKEITVINVRRQNRSVLDAIDIIQSAKGSLDFMLTHQFPLEQTRDAFELVAKYGDGVIKAYIKL